MAIPLSDNILTNAPKPSDARFGPWQTVAEACTNVPVSRRYLGLTVGVLIDGVEVDHAWAIDLTDGMLLPKYAAPSPGNGSGGSITYKTLTFLVTTAGAQSIPLPAGAAGVFAQARTEYGVLRPFDVDHYSFSNGRILIGEAAKLAQGEEVQVIYSLGGSTGGSGSGRDNNNVDAAVQVAVTDTGHTWVFGDLTDYATPTLQAAATNGVQKGDFFDSLESGSTVDAYRYTYCLQNNGSLGWTRLYKLQ